ncbi:hypothetical protein OIY81_2509 [Cryptosporidium canis]|nr:hypothetical protein OIY81_2509 [Cryptosporidium canis]
MGLGQRKSRKAGRSKNRAVGKYVKTKRRTKDFETVQNDYIKGVELPVDMDLPGHGQFYCITCGRYFINSASLMSHNKSKDHKRIPRLPAGRLQPQSCGFPGPLTLQHRLKRVQTEEAWTENHSMLAAEMTK